MEHHWEYPTAARFYSAMAFWVSSSHNIKHFLERAVVYGNWRALGLVEHNIKVLRQAEADTISWASRD